MRSLPDGYASIIADDTCAGRQRQRIALVRALVRDPELLVLDEPTAALDAGTAASVMRTLRRGAARRTVVMVTHHLRDAALATRIVVFEQGRVVETGTHEELLGRGGAYASLWRNQQNVLPLEALAKSA